MDLNNEEKELINNYIPTLRRFDKVKINYKYFKNPFKEFYILKLVTLYDDSILIGKIINKINNHVISDEDIYFSLNYYYNFNLNHKSNVQKFIFQSNENNMTLLKFKTNLILFTVKYYQYYFVINELLFDNNENNENNHELFFSIYLYLKCNKNNDENINDIIKKYSKKYFNMKLFFYIVDDLYKIYKKNLDILYKNEIIDNNNPILYFINNIFINWNVSYKKYINDNTFNNIQKKYEIKKNIIYNFVCKNNLC